MRSRRLIWQLYPSYLAIFLLVLFAVSWFSIDSFRKLYLQQTAHNLEVRARALSARFLERFATEHTARLDEIAKRIGKKTSTRITLMRPDGTVVGDSHEPPEVAISRISRPEVMTALTGQTGRSVRYSDMHGQNMMYVAIPIIDPSEQIVGVIRTALPITAVERELAGIRKSVLIAGLCIALLAALVSWYMARRISRPIERMRDGAEHFAAGELDFRLDLPNSQELEELATAMNRMAERLNEQLSAIRNQRNETDAVLSSMIEGVVAVDVSERIIRVNQAALEMLEAPEKRVEGLSVPEVVRNTSFQELVRRALSERVVAADEITLYGDKNRFIQATASPLYDSSSACIGALLVLHDVTSLRRLESMRRDFVANVSHELKTPITSIKGFVETLLDGALSDPEDARRFLEIVGKHTDRLNALVEDLLKLSRVEQEEDNEQLAVEPTPISNVIDTAVQACLFKAAAKRVSLSTSCDPGLIESVNIPFMEQAVINLIDNAIKYSKEGDTVRIEVSQNLSGTSIRVSDQGGGIEAQHHGRLFERFYRVDEGRSRDLGGTGLGLAIVKHVAQAHGGSAEVESELGKGSTFSINIPNPSSQQKAV